MKIHLTNIIDFHNVDLWQLVLHAKKKKQTYLVRPDQM